MKKAVCVLVLFHFTLVVATIVHNTEKWLHRGPWEKPLMLYSGVSYAAWRFGFFAPDVGKSTEVEIKVYDDTGEVHRYDTLEGFRFFGSLETSNRFYAFKIHCVREKPLQDLCARSVATRMLNLHPDASRVDYATRSIRYPSMDEYRRGAPVRKVEYYSTTFVLRRPGTNGGSVAPSPSPTNVR